MGLLMSRERRKGQAMLRLQMFELLPDERIVNSSIPLNDKGRLRTCSQCSQIAFRILHIQSSSSEREIGLCSAHLNEAGMAHPEIRALRPAD
jgi:hypothetical protein